eukprot:COSAG01_NODE_31710_length_592_cov_2.772819_2_plen_64_part_01
MASCRPCAVRGDGCAAADEAAVGQLRAVRLDGCEAADEATFAASDHVRGDEAQLTAPAQRFDGL